MTSLKTAQRQGDVQTLVPPEAFREVMGEWPHPFR